MLKCRDIARMASDQLDRPLPFRQRVSFRMHLLMCRLCRRYVRQLVLLRRAGARLGEMPGSTARPLSQAARERIAARLRAGQRNAESPPAQPDG